MKVTVQLFRDYLNCKRKLFLREQGETGEENDYTRFIAESRKRFGAQAINSLCENNKTYITLNDAVYAHHLRLGAPLLLGVIVNQDSCSVRIDALKRVAGKSALGDFHYRPVFFHSGETIRNSERLLLALQGLMLGALQHHLPSTGLIIIGDSFRCSTVKIESHYAHAREILGDVADISSGKVEPPLVLNKHCHECLYTTLCRDKAISEDNLSLFDRIAEQDIQKYNNKGIFSIHQLSYTFRPRRRSKRAKNVAQPHNPALQALALRENRIYVFEKPGISTALSRVYVDMEGDERGQFVYLIGILVVKNETCSYHALWADKTDEERNIFDQFIDILMSPSPVHLFHYGSYEGRVFKRIASISQFTQRTDELILQKEYCTNALTRIFGNVYFPTYSNQLKEIGRYLGCSWSEKNASGRYSMMWRKQWEESKNVSDQIALKDKIIRYNREDCLALKTVVECLTRIDAHEVGKADLEGRTAPAFVENIFDRDRPGKFGRKDFASKDFEIITRCAYFDYQQTKVFIRTDSKKRSRTQRLQIRNRRPTYRVNQVVEFRAMKCTHCGSTNVHRDPEQYYSKLTLDLRITSSAIKRWVTKLQHVRHTCKACNRHVIPKRYKLQPHLGHSLTAWAIHQHVVNRTTFEQMEATLRDHFGLQVGFRKLHELKSIAATYYAKAYRNIIKELVAGKLIHADETKVRLQKEDGYVWVFANTENVLYLYRPSRKADFLRDFLSSFGGVLVTDFYTGYDSMQCLHQKCLVHLLRDINDALLKHPFDAEVKDFGYRFGELLRQIVDTIDRFGLRKRYLAKHKKDTEKWLRDIEGITFKTELVEKLRKRVVKYGPRLFEFLNHDGVPWNNNNAEHAVKPFAKYRRLVNGRVTERGISDYLVLLSIYETCHYRGLSFWDFLLSGLRDINHFVEGNLHSKRSRKLGQRMHSK